MTLAALLIAASLALIAGRFTRVALPVATILFGSFAALGWGFTIGTENVLRAIAATMAVFALLTPSWYLDRASARDPIPGWGVRLVQVQMTILYAATALAKWQGSSWRSGEAIVDALSPVHTLRFQAPAMLSESGVVSAAVTWIVLGLETLLPVLLWHPRTRRIAVVGAILGHAAFGIFIELGLFPLAMTTGLVAFLSDDDAVGVVTWPSRIRASRSGRARPQSRPA